MDIPVSFLVVTYNQEKYVEEALVSALNQDYPCLEIVISDDGSSDGTWSVIKKTVGSYYGPHKIIIRRNEINSGLATNFNNGLKECSGELIVVQAGDDISESNRVQKLVELWIKNNKKPDLLYSNIKRINMHGELIRVDDHIHVIPSIEEIKDGSFYIAGGMAAAYTKRLFDKYGLLAPEVKTEDYVLSFRALLAGGIAFDPEALLKYRIHDESTMGLRSLEHDKYLKLSKYARAKIAESEDRYKSWVLSGHHAPFFEYKLKRAVLTARIEFTIISDSFLKKQFALIQALLTLRISCVFIYFQSLLRKPNLN